MKRTIAEFSDTDSIVGREEQESTRSVKKQKIATKKKGNKSEWSKKYPFVPRRSIRRLARYGVK